MHEKTALRVAVVCLFAAFTLGDAARVASPTVVTAGNDNCSTTNDITEDAKSAKDIPIDEYFVEHEVSMAQAKAAAKQLDPDSMDAAAGCQPCTRHEIHYCLGPALMNDHCCCDRRYKEVFPHVPHTCYLGERLCQPIARDCGEYIRLRACCCDKYVAYKWKAISSANRLSLSWLWFLLLIVLRIT